MKRTFSFVLSMLILASTYASDVIVNSKVLESFNQTFTSAENVEWFETSEQYSVSFKQSGIRATVKYDKKGRMISSIRYYSPDLLPVSLTNKVKASFPQASLFGVTEVTVGDRLVYFINLQDEASWTNIKVNSDGTSEVIEKYTKS